MSSCKIWYSACLLCERKPLPYSFWHAQHSKSNSQLTGPKLMTWLHTYSDFFTCQKWQVKRHIFRLSCIHVHTHTHTHTWIYREIENTKRQTLTGHFKPILQHCTGLLANVLLRLCHFNCGPVSGTAQGCYPQGESFCRHHHGAGVIQLFKPLPGMCVCNLVYCLLLFPFLLHTLQSCHFPPSI